MLGVARWIIGALAALGACSQSETAGADIQTLVADAPPAPTLRVCGSTAVVDHVLPALWKQFQAGRDTNAVEITTTATGSTEGLAALRGGSCDLALYTGPWTPVDGVDASLIARDAIVVATNPGQPAFTDVSVEQLEGWYRGEGQPKGLALFAPSTEHDRYAPLGSIDTSNSAASATPPAVDTPWVWFESALRLVDQTGFTPVGIKGPDGHAHQPSIDTIAGGRYPLTRDVHALVQAGDAGSSIGRSFAAFAASPEASETLVAHYLVPPGGPAGSGSPPTECGPPVALDGERLGWIGFGQGVSDSPTDARQMSKVLRSAGKRAYAKKGGLVVVGYASHDETCEVAEGRAAAANEALTEVVDELAKLAPWGAEVPMVRVAVSGPTRHWGVRPSDNRQVLVLLTPQAAPTSSAK